MTGHIMTDRQYSVLHNINNTSKVSTLKKKKKKKDEE